MEVSLNFRVLIFSWQETCIVSRARSDFDAKSVDAPSKHTTKAVSLCAAQLLKNGK